MKIRLLALLLLSLAFFSSQAYSAEIGMVRMGIVQGDVQIFTEDTNDWVPAAVNTPLAQGDRVWVPEGGRSELQVQGGLFIRLADFTSLDILSLEDNTYQFSVNAGRAYIYNLASGSELLQFDTPVSSVTCNDSATIMIDVEENGTTEISVLQGSVYVDTRNGRTSVPSGRTLRIGEDLRTEIYSLNSPDEWVEWNRDLDRRISEYSSSNSYLPEELDSYSYDFDTNGRWLYDNSYGYVWTPAIAVSINWAPYHNGRWVWIGGNYVWISSEHWGWAPYHYGRWVFLPRGGWCWVPPRRGAVYWGPGYVGWVYTANYVSWVPLAPGDTYYGHGYYGPGSVNINTVPNSNFSTNRNYRNRNARNAIKVVHRDTFLRGRHVAVPATENPFNQRNVGIGPPRFKPDRETFSPELKTIPAAKLPPQRIRTISPDSLRKERARATDKRGSVITPAIRTRELPLPSRETPKKTLREQRPDTYSDGLQRREEVQPQKRNQMKRELPVQQNQPVTIVTPPTPKRTIEQGAPTGSRQQRQPATIKVAPQPTAPQPIAPTPVWTPSKPRLQEKVQPPARQLPMRTPVPTIQKTIPAVPHVQVPAAQPRQLQKQPQTFRQNPQTIRQQKPVAVQPIANQPPVSQETTTTATPESRQQRGQKGERPSLQKGDRKGGNR
jgi:hypothetical protein